MGSDITPIETTVEIIRPPTMEEMLACVRREISMRKALYPSRVRNGRMKQADADAEIRKMEGVLALLLNVHTSVCAAAFEEEGL